VAAADSICFGFVTPFAVLLTDLIAKGRAKPSSIVNRQSAIVNLTEQTKDQRPSLRKGKETRKADQDKNGKRLILSWSARRQGYINAASAKNGKNDTGGGDLQHVQMEK
jgi:hypothetical protein